MFTIYYVFLYSMWSLWWSSLSLGLYRTSRQMWRQESKGNVIWSTITSTTMKCRKLQLGASCLIREHPSHPWTNMKWFLRVRNLNQTIRNNNNSLRSIKVSFLSIQMSLDNFECCDNVDIVSFCFYVISLWNDQKYLEVVWIEIRNKEKDPVPYLSSFLWNILLKP